jgi:hypothetical protein
VCGLTNQLLLVCLWQQDQFIYLLDELFGHHHHASFTLHPFQDPTSGDIESTVASLYSLLTNTSSTSACPPSTDDGAGWIQAATQVGR